MHLLVMRRWIEQQHDGQRCPRYRASALAPATSTREYASTHAHEGEHTMPDTATTESERVSPQGAQFDANTLRDFIRLALSQPAVSEQVDEQLQERIDGKITTAQLTGKLRPILTEALEAASDVDWSVVGRDFLTDAESVLGAAWPVLDEGDRWLIDVVEQELRESTQNAGQLRARARKLRAEAELHSGLPGIRDTALVLADRYERAAAAQPEPELHPWPELPEEDRWRIERIEQHLLEPTESKEQLLTRARELRAQAEQTETPRTREIALALADRYEHAKGTNPSNDAQTKETEQ
jgi:hypothetical protein